MIQNKRLYLIYEGVQFLFEGLWGALKVYHHQGSYVSKVVHRENVLALAIMKIFRGQGSGLGGAVTYQ